MAKIYRRTQNDLKIQRKLNREAEKLIKDLAKFRGKCNKLKPLMWKYDFEVLAAAIGLVRLELRNQILNLG